MERLPFEFVGTTTAPLSVDPSEFTGMTVPQISQELLKMLREIKPDANFFEDDTLLAAEAVHAAVT